MNFFGAPYPIVRHPLGLLRTQKGASQIKSDLLVLLLTEPGERVMLPEFGTPLKQFIFEPNDFIVEEKVQEVVADSIRQWEPRIAVSAIDVSNSSSDVSSSLSPDDTRTDAGHVLLIRILFSDFNNINNVEELKLEIPLGGS